MQTNTTKKRADKLFAQRVAKMYKDTTEKLSKTD